MSTDKAGSHSAYADDATQDEYVTQRFALASFLCARSWPLTVRLQPSAVRRCDFVFPRSPALQADIAGYENGTVAILPKSLEDARKKVALMMGDVKREGQR